MCLSCGSAPSSTTSLGTQLKKGLSIMLADTDSGINHNPASCADCHCLCFIYSTPAVFVVVNNGFFHRYDITPLHNIKNNKNITPNKTANKTAPFNHISVVGILNSK